MAAAERCRWLGAFSLLTLGVGCVPPDPIGLPDGSGSASPEIRILYPDPDVPIALDDDGLLRTLVVVDILGAPFSAPEGSGDAEDEEVHWHLFVQETEYVAAPAELYVEIESDAFVAGSRGILNVDLRLADHSPLADADPDCLCEDRVEFDAIEAPE